MLPGRHGDDDVFGAAHREKGWPTITWWLKQCHKYSNRLPLYHQAVILQRDARVEIGQATLDGWVVRVGELLSPVVAAMRQDLLRGSYLQADEMIVVVQMHDRRGADHQKPRNAVDDTSTAVRQCRYVLHDRDSKFFRALDLASGACLSRLILFIRHFHFERNHQGAGNVLLFPASTIGTQCRPVRCRKRMRIASILLSCRMNKLTL